MSGKCNVPVIINVASGFYCFNCTGDLGHIDPHSYSTQSINDAKIVTVSWEYLGSTVAGNGGISPARHMSDRCRVWSHIPALRITSTNRPSDKLSGETLFRTANGGLENVGFCCAEKPGHSGDHVRSGVFDHLGGIKWSVSWS